MLELIVNTAQADERIRAVIMNGSRANPKAQADILQDYDIVYLVTEVAPFANNMDWIRRFGELMMRQMPDLMQEPPEGEDKGFTYLMQFTDGNRIDLKLYPIVRLPQRATDSQSVLLLDKDRRIAAFPPPSDRDHLPQPPSTKGFADCCNEFWWTSAYLAKGLWRQELPYARYVLEHYMRDELLRMLTWYIGVKSGFAINPGKFGKHFEQHLEPELWDMLCKTYAEGTYAATWTALFAMCDLFRIAAVRVGDEFGFRYPYDDDHKMSAHLRHVQALPRDAKQMY